MFRLSPAPLLLAALVGAAPTLAAQSLTDANIVALFDAANTADIETSDLAAGRAASPEVRELAEAFAAAHRSVRQQGRDLAARLGVAAALPAGDQSLARHQEAMRSLAARRGAAFDRAYLDHEIAFHDAVIQAVTTTLLPAIRNPELKGFVEKIAPAFVAHLEHARNVRAKLGS